MNQFVSLHLNSEYSLLQSTIKINNLIDFALKNNLKSLVLTDHNVLSGVSEFVHKCQINNIKPIIGLDLDVENYRLILLAKNYQGYIHLIKLSSQKMHGKNIQLTDIVPNNIFIIDHPTFGHFAKFNSQLKLRNYYIGTTNKNVAKNAVFVNDTRILYSKDENQVLKILYKIAHNQTAPEFDLNPYPINVDKNDYKVKNAILIANECNVDFNHVKLELPNFKTPDNLSPFDYLKKIINHKKINILSKKTNISIYQKRLNDELKIIEKLKFANYFLIIHDIVDFAKNKKILVGPGRGSVAGSLVAYILNITEVDPIKFELIFERFLNPNRISMPDIDLDFQDTRRDEVINYIFQKYGHNHVGLISTFQRLGPKMALRDVARDMGIHNSEVDIINQTIPNLINSSFDNSLDSIYQNVTPFRVIINKKKQYMTLFERAKLIEGLPRQIGTHAAGVVISNFSIETKVPTLLGLNGLNQTQFPMDFLEEQGLLKIDILGLKNLTILQDIQKEVKKNYHRQINLQKIPLNDKLTNDLLSRGDTNGIFQLESYGMKKTLIKLGVDSVDDVTAVISLYRPGPMENIPLYVEGKKTHNFIEIDSSINDILKSTYGIIVYQEQIMEIVVKFSGMDLTEADNFRRAIGKKDSTLLSSLKSKFIEKAKAKGHSINTIEKVYNYIYKFANFGFNKSHGVAYAILAYRLAYLKARFPLEFYTAIINSSLNSIETMKLYINEAKNRNIKISGPDIKISNDKVYNLDKKIILPFTIIKGIGAVASQKIIEARKNYPFKNIFIVITQLKFFGIGDNTINLLIKANTMRDFFNINTLLHVLPSIIRYSNMVIIKDKIDYQVASPPEIIIQKQNLVQEVEYEKQILGLPINVFITSPYEKAINLANLPLNQNVQIVVLLEKIFSFKTKNNDQMGKILCSDSSSTKEINVFPGFWKEINKTMINKLCKIQVVKKISNNIENINLVKKMEILEHE